MKHEFDAIRKEIWIMDTLIEKLSRLKELVEEYEKLDNQIGGWKEDEYIKESDLNEIFEIIKSL